MQSAIVGAILFVIVAVCEGQFRDDLLRVRGDLNLNALDRQLMLQGGLNVVGGRGSRLVRQQLRQQQALLEEQALNNALVSQQLRRQGGVQVGGVVSLPRVGGVGYGVTGGLNVPKCCLSTSYQKCLALNPLSSYASGQTCTKFYFEPVSGTCQSATFDSYCAKNRNFSNYFSSLEACLNKCQPGLRPIGGY